MSVFLLNISHCVIFYRNIAELCLLVLHLFARLAEAALALLIVDNRPAEVVLGEVGPEGVGEIQLRVGDLPQQEVADAQVAGGANEQVGVGDATCGETVAEQSVVDVVDAYFAILHPAGNALHALENLPLRGVAEGEI